jgi:hypothetical protein
VLPLSTEPHQAVRQALLAQATTVTGALSLEGVESPLEVLESSIFTCALAGWSHQSG